MNIRSLMLLFLISLITTSCSNDKIINPTRIKNPKKFSKEESWKGKKKVALTEELTIGTEEFDQDEYYFSVISDIDIDVEGNIYVLDSKAFRVQKYSNDGKFLFSYKTKKGQGPGEFLRPKCVFIDRSMNIYVGDTNQKRITVFNSQGELIKTLKTDIQPADVIVAENKKIYITGFFDFSDYRIYKYDFISGKLESSFCNSRKETKNVATVGESGKLYLDPKGNIYFSFCYPYEIRKFKPNGELIDSFARYAKFFYTPMKKDEITGGYKFIATNRRISGFHDNKIICVIRHLDRENKIRAFYFDIFDDNGQWLLSFPSSDLDSDWVRNFTTDSFGNIYLDYIEPYPHIRKYSMKIVDH